MDEHARYAVGLDVGSENVRAVVADVNRDGKISVVGYGQASNTGMRKGIVANLSGPAAAIDKMLGEVERMSGHEVDAATVSINGSHIISTKTEGMIAVGAEDHEINGDDLMRVEEVAVTGRIPANRDVLDVVPLSYELDGQGGVKDPIGMTGSRLVMKANVISALSPNCENIKRATGNANVVAEHLVPSVVASARAVLSERQIENGVAVMDLGAATTSIAIFEESDLQYVGVVPAGAHNITNDLAIMLEIPTDAAEELKQKYASGDIGAKEQPVKLKINGAEVTFDRAEIDAVVEARLKEIFDRIAKEIKAAKYEKRLPEGLVLVGGGAKLKEIDIFAKRALGCSVKIGMPIGCSGVADAIAKPEFATAAGLMMLAADRDSSEPQQKRGRKRISKKKKSKKSGLLQKLFGKI